MFYFKRLIHGLLALTIIIGLSACSSSTSTKATKNTSKASTQNVEQSTLKSKTQNEASTKVNQQLDELFTPAIPLTEAKKQLATYKAQGKVGEKINGFLAVIQDRKATRKLVKTINQERLKHYKKIALDNQLTLQEVEDIAGKKSTEKAKKGHYIQKNRQWIKK
ncbi:MAG: YdbL family protein [Thiomicrorhabdus sp.]|nr:YdbL family protein [Thiomicrorhabdus sp.]